MGGLDVFPMPPSANYNYARAFDRRQGGHHGTDVFAPRGTPLLAVFDGEVRATTDPKGGNVIYLEGVGLDARRAYYAHLDSVEAPLALGEPQFVNAGDVIGYVGNSGNAATTPPHLHFQLSNPGLKGIVDPFDHLESVDPKRGGASVDPSKPKPPPVVDLDETTGEISLSDDAVLIGGGLLALLALWWLFGSSKKESTA